MLGALVTPLLAAAANFKPAAAPTRTPVGVPSAQPVALPPNAFGPVNFGTQHPLLLGIVQALFVISAIALIALMSAQTTKTEGLSGTIGGRAEAAYRGRLGMSEQLARLTTFVAVSFIVVAILFFLITR